MEYSPPVRRVVQGTTDLERLKPMAGAQFYALDSNVRLLWFLGRLIFWSLILMVFLFLGLFGVFTQSGLRMYLPLAFGVLLVLALIHLIWPFISYKHWGYALRPTDFLIRSGVIWKRMSAVPFSRIQHVDSDAGPIERSFGIANLVIHTAGSHSGSLTLPGLPAERAESLRDYLSEVGHTHANL